MKARPFLAVLLALVLVVFALGLAGWWLVWHRSALRLQRQPLEIPRAARFVPREAPLSLYLFSDGDQPVAYARAVAPPRQRRQAAEAVARLRDGAFAAAGLDYDAELRSWLAAPVGLALLEPPPPAGPTASGSGTASPRGAGCWSWEAVTTSAPVASCSASGRPAVWPARICRSAPTEGWV